MVKMLGYVLNLTQHAATHDQVADWGVKDPSEGWFKKIQELLTFVGGMIPAYEVIEERADALADIAEKLCCPYDKTAMIGGAPWLMEPLERALHYRGVMPLYAFSSRVSEEVQQPDGTVRKIQLFKHEGFVKKPNSPMISSKEMDGLSKVGFDLLSYSNGEISLGYREIFRTDDGDETIWTVGRFRYNDVPGKRGWMYLGGNLTVFSNTYALDVLGRCPED